RLPDQFSPPRALKRTAKLSPATRQGTSAPLRLKIWVMTSLNRPPPAGGGIRSGLLHLFLKDHKRRPKLITLLRDEEQAQSEIFVARENPNRLGNRGGKGMILPRKGSDFVPSQG
ncbi:MAG: hypothetical protein ACREAM_22505, partial [Blastocatellia bacterium]